MTAPSNGSALPPTADPAAAAPGNPSPDVTFDPTTPVATTQLQPHRAPALQPPYYVVVFTSQRNGVDRAGYYLMAEHMVALARHQPGYLGMHAARGPDGLGITVSFWRSQADILAWKRVAEHQLAQQAGQAHWYAGYELQVARVERGYAFGVPLGEAHAGPASAPVDNEPGMG
jgi:heme-degrading monooxygenase HmoA